MYDNFKQDFRILFIKNKLESLHLSSRINFDVILIFLEPFSESPVASA